MQLAKQLTAYGLHVFPVTNEKRPATKGWQHPLPVEQYKWPSGRVGVVIPPGVFVIDIDTYKGATTADIDRALGCALPWVGALVQTTAKGGQHYAFRYDGGDLLQGTNLLGVDGFDTRRAGSGFIVTGEGYTPTPFGLVHLAHPSMLPALPPQAAAALRKPERPPQRPTRPLDDTELANMRDALSVLDPGCGRSEWWQVLAAVRNLTAHDPEVGLQVFDAWSAGELSPDHLQPHNYAGPDDIEHQWFGTKPDGGIAGGTLYHKAMAAGWRPPRTFDVASAFGMNAAPADQYADIIDEINAHGIDPKHQPRVIDLITTFPGSPSQVATLRGLMVKILKDDGQLTKRLRELLDGGKAAPQSATTDPAHIAALPDVVTLEQLEAKPISRATGVHGSNAALMLGEVFGGRLASFDGALRWWTGVEWQKADEAQLLRLTSAALSPDQDKMPNVKGTVAALILKAQRRTPAPADRRVYFQNGVLDVATGYMAPHHPDNNNTGALSVPYDPTAPLGEWAAHLDRLFGGLYDGGDRVALLQEIAGWALVRDDLNVQKCVAFDGATRAGKGVILDALAAILGSKCGYVNFANMANGKTQSAFIHHDVVVDHEAKPPQRQEIKEALGFMNKVASNEPVSIQLLHTQTPWTGRLGTKLLFACNGVPVMVDDSGASSTRFLVLRFDRSFAGVEDKGIAGRMAGCLPAVAAWAVEGLRRLIANDGRFTEPASSAQATDDMRDGNQPLREFIAEWCVLGAEHRCHSKQLWDAYRSYTAEANVRTSSKHAFLRSLRATLIGRAEEKRAVRIDGTVSNGWEGINVRNPFTMEAPQ